MAFDWEGILGEDEYDHVCQHGLDCYGYSNPSSNLDNFDDYGGFFAILDDYDEDDDEYYDEFEGVIFDDFETETKTN